MNKFIVAARAVIVKDNKILLVSKDQKVWVTPGGMLDKGENLTDGLKREMLEELGLAVEPQQLLYVSELDDTVFGNKKLEVHFACKYDGEIQLGQDPDQMVFYAQFFSLDEIQDMAVFPLYIKKGEWITGVNNPYKGCFSR